MSLRILLVEDDPLVARAFVRKLESRGHEVVHVTSIAGAERAITFGVAAPQVIIADREVEDGDAWEWARRFHAELDADDVLVVFMTGAPSANPPAGFFLKSDQIARLIETIEGQRKEREQ